jgi:gas vesicle protein
MEFRSQSVKKSADALKESIDKLVHSIVYLEQCTDTRDREAVREISITLEKIRAAMDEMAERHLYIAGKIEEVANKALHKITGHL